MPGERGHGDMAEPAADVHQNARGGQIAALGEGPSGIAP
jgi:hypothetical protein